MVKGALAQASPFMFVAVRFTVAAALMVLVMARGRLPRETVLPGLLLGTLLFVGFACQTWGLLSTTPSKSAFITGFSVILVPVISCFQGYPLRLANAAGAALGLTGIYLLFMPSGVASVNRGDWLTLCAAVAFAFHIVGVGVYTRRLSFRYLAPSQVLVVAMLAALFIPFRLAGPVRWRWSSGLVLAIIYTAVFTTAIALATQIWAQQYTPPAHTALIFSLEPVFAAFISCIVTKEHLGRKVLIGCALILAGMVVSELWGGASPSPVEG